MKLHKILSILVICFFIHLIYPFCFVQAMSSISVLNEENTPYLNRQTLALAAQSPAYTLTVTNSIYTTWSSSNSSVALVDNFGQVTPLSEGSAVITVTAASIDGTVYSLTCDLQVTNPKFSDEKVEICLSKQDYIPITIEGLQTYSTIIWDSTDSSIAKIDLSGKAIYGFKEGSATITAIADGRTLTCEVYVTNNAPQKETSCLAIGETKSLSLEDNNEPIVWSSKNPKIASVSETGVVKAKKLGIAQITAKTNSDSFTWYICVVDSNALKAVSMASSAIGGTYSQEKRMEEGYYDCSSLTWKSYSPYGITFGMDSWAPTAADQAKWCVKNNKIIAKSGIDIEELKLLPGDLIFYARDKKNNRYKNIYHVAIFTGYELETNELYKNSFMPEQENNFSLKGTIIEANGTKVSENYYVPSMGSNRKIVFIARPTKMN